MEVEKVLRTALICVSLAVVSTTPPRVEAGGKAEALLRNTSATLLPVHEALHISSAYLVEVISEIDPGLPSNRVVISKLEGVRAFRRGRFAEAIEHFDNALNISGDDRDALWLLARALYRNGQNQRAMEVCKRAILLYPNFYPAKITKACVLHALAQDDGHSCEQYLNLISNADVRKGDSAYFDYMLGTFAFANGDFEKAVMHFSNSLAGASTYFQIDAHHLLFKRGHSQMKLGNYELAYTDVRQGLVAAGKWGRDEESVFMFLRLAERTGRYNMAYVEGQNAVAEFPESTKLKETLILTMMRLGRKEEAASLISETLTKDPTSRVAVAMRKKLDAATRSGKLQL